MILEEAERIVEGLKIELRLFENAKGVIAIEDNKLDAIELLQKLVEKEENIELSEKQTNI